MNRKSLSRKTLLVILVMTALWLVVEAFHGYQVRRQNWNERMHTALFSVLKDNMEKCGKEDVYMASHSYSKRNSKDDIPKIVTMDVGEGPKEYIVPAYKHYNNIEENPTERLFDSIILEEHPLKADSLNILWDSLLVRNGISCYCNIRVSVIDLSGGISTAYAKDSRYLSVSDSLFSFYIGYRCEAEVTAFASPFSYWRNLTLWDWATFFFLLLAGVYIYWNWIINNKRSVGSCECDNTESIPVERKAPVAVVRETASCIYQLGDDVWFDSTNRLLRRGSQIKILLPQVSALLLGLLEADGYCMSISDICLLLWPDGSGRSERVHTVAGRLRASLTEISSQISIISGNSRYQLKIAHFIAENADSDTV